MDAAEKGEVTNQDLGDSFQVEEVARLLSNGELVDVGDLWTGELHLGGGGRELCHRTPCL